MSGRSDIPPFSRSWSFLGTIVLKSSHNSWREAVATDSLDTVEVANVHNAFYKNLLGSDVRQMASEMRKK